MNYRFYHQKTGIFAPAAIGATSREDALANCPAEHLMLEGEWDHRRHCVDLASGEVIVRLETEIAALRATVGAEIEWQSP